MQRREKFGSKEGEKVENVIVAEAATILTKTGGKRINFIDKDGRKFHFFDKVGIWDDAGNRTGEKPSASFTEWAKLGDAVGRTLEVGFKESEEEFKGVPYTSRKVMFLKEIKSDGNYERATTIETPEGAEEIPF